MSSLGQPQLYRLVLFFVVNYIKKLAFKILKTFFKAFLGDNTLRHSVSQIGRRAVAAVLKPIKHLVQYQP